MNEDYFEYLYWELEANLCWRNLQCADCRSQKSYWMDQYQYAASWLEYYQAQAS